MFITQIHVRNVQKSAFLVFRAFFRNKQIKSVFSRKEKKSNALNITTRLVAGISFLLIVDCVLLLT
jgi:hypothetical protein